MNIELEYVKTLAAYRYWLQRYHLLVEENRQTKAKMALAYAEIASYKLGELCRQIDANKFLEQLGYNEVFYEQAERSVQDYMNGFITLEQLELQYDELFFFKF